MMTVKDVDHRQFIQNSEEKFMKGLRQQIEYSPCAPPKKVTKPSDVSN